MATLKDIRKRIQSVKNTKQITRSMKLVASAKLRKSQENILKARPYAYRIYLLLLHILKLAEAKHPLLLERAEKKIRLIIISGDRGLCGSFNSNIIKFAERFIKDKESSGISIFLDIMGKKAYDYFKTRRTVSFFYEHVLENPNYSNIAAIAENILTSYIKEEFDAAYLVYNEFKSAIQQKVIVEKLIPIDTSIPEGMNYLLSLEHGEWNRYLFEPSKEEIINRIVPKHFKVQLFRAVLESVASEHGARMSAMDNATRNAEEMIGRLTLIYNKARQASITKELMEIVGGVEAMK